MGGTKALAPWNGTTLIAAVIDRMAAQASAMALNARPDQAQDLARFGLPVLVDDEDLADLGPLSGVRTALAWAQARGNDHVVTAPCDMPDLPKDMVARLMAADAADIAYFATMRDHPLCARWSVSLLPGLEAALAGADGGLAVMRFVERQTVIKLPTEDDAAFANINSL
ncbi:molybdenum cofactor guanylyltransferase [Asticcacaulis solisilvae]|uniref:molybdenum cofactor guanylyltransferase n=1 Tax=Asticcacaulis solisilvae TaxID=1217274 RepID=UPI003FD704F2